MTGDGRIVNNNSLSGLNHALKLNCLTFPPFVYCALGGTNFPLQINLHGLTNSFSSTIMPRILK